MKSVVCCRCAADGVITPALLDQAFKHHADLTGLQLRTFFLRGCLEHRWGDAGVDADGDHVVACPACATADEAAAGEDALRIAALLWEQAFGPGAEN